MAEGALAVPQVTIRDLSSRQQRELASLVAAGLASVAFFLVPALDLESSVEPLPSMPMMVQVAGAPAAPVAFALPEPVTRPAQSAQSPSVLLPHRDHPVLLLAKAAPDVDRAGRRSPNRLSRVLFGNGRYRVQPFPLLPSE